MTSERRKQVEELFGRAAGLADEAAVEGAPRDARPKAVAVLPFRTLNAPAGEETGEFLGVGLADALITRLSNARGLTVRPTSSVMRFAREEADPVAAGRQLAADYVVDGHLLRAGGRVRVTVQLIGVERGAPLWAARFDESHADILALHDSLSEQVARELIPRLAGGGDVPPAAAPARRGTRNPAAYEAYMRGRLHWNSMAEDGFAKAILLYNEAAALDPSYAAAHSGIADYHNWLGVLGVLPPRECFRAAKEAAARAAALDPSSAEAYAALGFACHAQCEWRAAERHFRRALELNPNHAGAHQWYGFLLASLRRSGEAVTECRRAQEIAHDSPALRQGFAWVFYQSRRYEESHALNQEVLAVEPNFALTLYTESRALSMLGRHGEAVEAARRACDVTGASPTFLGQLGYACALAGLEGEARGVLARLGELARTRYVSAFQTALIHAALGEPDEALARLSESIEQREAWLCWIRTEPGLDPLRTDPRFQTVFERVLLQESAPQAAPQPAAVEQEAASEVDESEAVVGVSDAGAPRVSLRRPAVRRHSALHHAGLVVLGALLATLAALAALIYVAPWEDGAVDSVAVLPFVNVNSDPEVEYIADGVAEHLINQLAQLSSVRVMARTTAFTYKGREVDARRAGREMGVGAVLVGRVARRGEVLAIEAELVRVEDGSRLWGAAYARGMAELPSVEQEMAAGLLSSLRPRLSGEERRQLARRATRDAEAYQLYLQGEYHRNRATPEDLRRAVEFFERSAARDPSNALAHAGLALSYRSLPAYGLMLPRDAYPRAKAAAERALSLDPRLASAHVPLAAIKFVYEWKFAEAEAQYREALRLNPNHAEAHFAYANFLTAMERFDEAMQEYEAAERLDPFSINIADGVVWSLFVSGRHEEALARCRRNLERDPRHAQTHLHMGEIYTAQGRYQEAAEALQKARELSNQTLVEIAFGHLYAVSGRREEALRIARDYEERVRAGRASPFLLAVIHAGLDDKDAAFAWLEKSYEERSNWMALLKVGRRLAPLQGDPRFRRLVERVGFPAPNKS